MRVIVLLWRCAVKGEDGRFQALPCFPFPLVHESAEAWKLDESPGGFVGAGWERATAVPTSFIGISRFD